MTNCVVVNNFCSASGGGAYFSTLYNCSLIGNRASYGGGANGGTLYSCTLVTNIAGSGGGINGGTLRQCLIFGNSANTGGGLYSASLYNCTVIGNYATNSGGGIYGGNLYNCVVYYNVASSGANYLGAVTMNNCCTLPMPANGSLNFTNAPLFVSYSAGNVRLQTNSPCIDVGNNSYNTMSSDLDGRPRIVSGTVDVGAYEFQGADVGDFIGWLQKYGLPVDGSADYADSDGTGMNNWQKWIAGLNPTNPASVLAMSPLVINSPTGVTVSWQSVNTRTYYLQRSTDLAALPAFITIQSNLVGQAGITSFVDASATNGGPYFYRVGVQ
jgi:predicted outer membrane repeat protein